MILVQLDHFEVGAQRGQKQFEQFGLGQNRSRLWIGLGFDY